MSDEFQDARVRSTETIRDIIIAMSDGLTVPFALAGAYIVGGAIPLAPYLFNSNARIALIPSVMVTLVTLVTLAVLLLAAPSF